MSDPFVTTPDEREAMRAWATARGLSYEPLGDLPPASDFLGNALDRRHVAHHAGTLHGRGAVTVVKDSKLRPGRFSENVCTGTLPGGAVGTLAHHTYTYRTADHDWRAVCDTVVLVESLEATRVTRGLTGRPQATRSKNIVITQAEYGAGEKEAELPLGERLYWEVDADEDTAPIAEAFDGGVVGALQATPKLTRVTIRDGWVAVELPEWHATEVELDALCLAASELAASLRRVAASLPDLDDAPLPPPADTPYRRYLDLGVSQLRWPSPPPDVKTAIEAYLTMTTGDARSRRRGRRGFATILALFAVIGLIVAVPALFISPAIAAVLFGTMVVVGALLGLYLGRGVERIESRERATAFGREAFAREYAFARGMHLEDAEELRRRITLPLHGRPERSLHGEMGDGVAGRVIWWRDRSDIGKGDRALMLALVAAPGAAEPAASPPFTRARASDRLVVIHDLDAQGGARTASGIDALRAEAARLSRVP